MKILGAILAGGAARRFGADKAAAMVGGVPMIERVIGQLLPQTDAVVICGREWRHFHSVSDYPEPGMGPLSGLLGALRYAAHNDFDAVLTSGCDLPELPQNLVSLLAPSPSVIAGQPLLGLWPATLAAVLEAHLDDQNDLSMAAWITRSGARSVAIDHAIANINTPDDLSRFIKSMK